MSKWVEFRKSERQKNRKTDEWAVLNKKSGAFVGDVMWNNGWRRYTFYPDESTSYGDLYFDGECMIDIGGFCIQATDDYRRNRELLKEQP